MSFRGVAVTLAGTASAPQPGIGGYNVALVVENTNVVAASGAAYIVPDPSVATLHRIALNANCTFTFPSAAAGKSFMIEAVQDATGGRLATWPANVTWAGGAAPTLTTAAGKGDLLSFYCFDGANWLGAVVAENY